MISSDFIEKHRFNKLKNETVQNRTEVESDIDDGSRKYLANCEKYEYVGSPTVEVNTSLFYAYFFLITSYNLMNSCLQIVNLTRFDEVLSIKPNITNRTIPASCVLALFYAHTCPFSAMVAPHFNALARTFPSIKMIAINTKKYQM